MKHLILAFFTLFFLIEGISQQFNFCGVLPPHQFQSTDPDSIMYDRFGNSYNAFYMPNPQQVLNCPSGYYELNIGAGISQDMCMALCQIFALNSTQFPRRSNFNECGDPIPQEPVRIDVRAING